MIPEVFEDTKYFIIYKKYTFHPKSSLALGTSEQTLFATVPAFLLWGRGYGVTSAILLSLFLVSGAYLEISFILHT